MAQYETWRKEYPHHVIIGSEWQYFTAHSLSADVMSQLLERDCKVSKNGKKSISTTNLDKWTRLLKNKSYAYLVFSGDKILELADGNNPFVDLPEIIYQTQIFQTISALKDGINPETGEFFDDQSFVFSNMTKEILSLAEKYLLLTEASISVKNKECLSTSKALENSDGQKVPEEEIGAFARYKQKLIEKGVVRAYEPWTNEEEADIIKDYESDSPITTIAEKHHRTPGAIRSRLKKLGIISDDNGDDEPTFIDTTIKEPAEITLRCEDCHSYRKGDCGGMRKASECDQYIPAVNISKEERALWPTMGDASAIRTRNYEHFR